MKDSRRIGREEIERQQEYMCRVRELVGDRPRWAMVDTYGCQQNEADSEQLRGMLLEMGFQPTQDEKQADLILINSCAVREHAEKRVLGNVGALSHRKREKPELLIGVCGCMVQQEHMALKLKKSYPYVSLVFGPHALYRLPELVYQVLRDKKRVFEISPSDGVVAEGLPVLRKDNIKGWVSVMYGCNNFCSYCIVPYVRGRERSRMPDEVVEEIRGLVRGGLRDVTLLGQNVNSYGKDLGEKIDFAGLLERVSAIEGDFRIRFMTSHPKDATKRLFDTMAGSSKICKHIHLPFQSGSDRILKLMNRRYDRKRYLELVEYARSVMPEISITSDVIVGFPGETEEDFEDTLHLVREVGFDALFTFLYSKRSGTPAAQMEDTTPEQVKKQRFERLLKLQADLAAKRNKGYTGKIERILVECEESPEGLNLLGRTDGNRPVRFAGDRALIGTFQDVEIKKCVKWSMEGELVLHDHPE